MSLFSRDGLDTKSWLHALRSSAPIILGGTSGLVLAWALLRILAYPTDESGAVTFYNLGSNHTIALAAYGVATLGDNVWIPLAFWLYVFRRNKHDWTSAMVIAAAIAITTSSTELLKSILNLPRPYEVVQGIQARFYTPSNAGYPSGHTSHAFTAATIIWFRYPGWRIPFLALAGSTGLSMIILGLHFPSDVIGGACIGIMSGGFVSNLARLRSDKVSVTTSIP